MTVMTATDEWRHALATLDRQCPWPGPRPLAELDLDEFGDVSHVLVGRERDRRDFLREVDTGHRLIFLTGPSGVGKTSLLQVGLVPVLRDHGYRVAVCRDWTRDDRDASPAEFLATKVRGQLVNEIPGLAEGPDMFWDLDRAGGVVLVLDQFEELLRWDPAMQRGLFDLITDLNQAATEITLVVSFRSEFLHEMRPLEDAAKAFSMSHFALAPLDPAFALDLITAPNHRGREVVTAGAATTIAAHWRRAVTATEGADATVTVRGGVGLLHLQALLYALYDAAPAGVITQDLVDGCVEDPVQIFVDGLARAAEVKLDRCQRAGDIGGVEVDPYLMNGATDLLARSVKHLASAGYKLVREVGDLAEVTFGDQLVSLMEAVEETGGEVDEQQLRALFAVLVDAAFGEDGRVRDLLELDRAEIAQLADARGPDHIVRKWSDRLVVTGPAADPTGVTCGPMLGMASAAVLIEEIRRFVFALVWLSESALVRVSRPGGETMISLVHDGFGAALAAWSIAVVGRPDGAFHALTAPRGAYLRWDDVEPSEPLVNLRWRGSTVTANFTNTTFVNCDFRGTLFLGCRLTAVSFVNCMLDGALFSDCSVRGALPPATGRRSEREPSFAVPVSGSLVSALARYRGATVAAPTLFSPPAGPAIPLTSDPADRDEFLGQIAKITGGMAIIGGRVSSFMLRRCLVAPESSVSFRHVSGSGLDVVEQPNGAYEFYGSALRHVSFTSRNSPRDDDRLDVVAVGSVLAQLWVGSPLRGTLKASNCSLVQIWNGSSSLCATAEDSAVMGCVGVDDLGGCTAIGDADTFIPVQRVDPSEELRAAARRMDYRMC
jgi:hypothetical protein